MPSKKTTPLEKAQLMLSGITEETSNEACALLITESIQTAREHYTKNVKDIFPILRSILGVTTERRSQWLAQTAIQELQEIADHFSLAREHEAGRFCQGIAQSIQGFVFDNNAQSAGILQHHRTPPKNTTEERNRKRLLNESNQL